jgi:hypothetical protein
MATKFNPKVGDLVYFEWEDHCSYRGCEWEPIRNIPKMLTGSFCETTGFVVEVTPNHITTVAHITKNDEDDGDHDGSQISTRLRRAIIRGKVIKRFK